MAAALMSNECSACGAATVASVPGLEELPRVTSDCKPWSSGGYLGVCMTCACVQSLPDASWEEDIGRIYQQYTLYYQAEGAAEASIFDMATGEAATRSARLLSQISERVDLPAKGRLLDVGCANGRLLHEFRKMRPNWTMIGTELDDKYKADVERIPGVERLHVGDLTSLEGQFDLITIVHVLEHVDEPLELLVALRQRLTATGVLVVAVPDIAANPFDLVIADHRTHFSNPTLTLLLERSGYEVLVGSTRWLPKEISIIARPGDPTAAPRHCSASLQIAQTKLDLAWLRSVIETARAGASSPQFGLFGTSIGATWVFGALGDGVSFFVDEDTSRVGRTHLRRPIVAPSETPDRSAVLLVLPYELARQVQTRLTHAVSNVAWMLPPAPITAPAET